MIVSSSFLLLRQLLIEQGVDGVLRLVHDGLGYDHVLRAEKLQGQLHGVVLGLADAPVGQLPDEHATALHLGPHDEVKRPVAHLLAHARLAKTLHGLRHGRVGRKKKILAVVVVSESGKTKCARFEKRNVQKSGKTKRSKKIAHTTL